MSWGLRNTKLLLNQRKQEAAQQDQADPTLRIRIRIGHDIDLRPDRAEQRRQDLFSRVLLCDCCAVTKCSLILKECPRSLTVTIAPISAVPVVDASGRMELNRALPATVSSDWMAEVVVMPATP